MLCRLVKESAELIIHFEPLQLLDLGPTRWTTFLSLVSRFRNHVVPSFIPFSTEQSLHHSYSMTASAKDPDAPKRGDPGFFSHIPDRAERGMDSRGPPREELPLPTRPPYTAYIGNLDFATTEGDLSSFFGDDNVSVQLD